MTELHQFGHASTLGDHVRVLRRRKWIVIATTAVVTALALVLSFQKATLYHARAQVLINQVSPAVLALGGTVARTDPIREGVTQSLIATGPKIAARVAARPEFQGAGREALRGSISVAPSSTSDLLTFEAANANPTLAVQLVNAYAIEYLAYRQQQATGSMRALEAKIEEKMNALKAQGREGSAVYAKYAEQAQGLQIAETIQSSTASFPRPAYGALAEGPKPVRDGILGFVLGGMLGIGLAFLWNALDTRIRGAGEVSERLGLPLLARVPEPPRRMRNQRKLVMLEEPDCAQAEAFRMLRTNLEFANLERGARSILITSGLEEEGKSTTVANLAVAFARTGKRVALVDLDLRRPMLARFFGLNGHRGLTDVALEHVDLDAALATIAVTSPHEAADSESNGRPNFNGNVGIDGLLEVLPTGPLPPDAGEFIQSRVVGEILHSLTLRADIVLIDAPPLLHVGDAMALTAMVDAVVLVSRLNVLRRPMVTELRRMMSTSPAVTLGFVLTGTGGDESYETAGYYAYVPRRKDREKV